jgi:hypothetical protein
MKKNLFWAWEFGRKYKDEIFVNVQRDNFVDY